MLTLLKEDIIKLFDDLIEGLAHIINTECFYNTQLVNNLSEVKKWKFISENIENIGFDEVLDLLYDNLTITSGIELYYFLNQHLEGGNKSMGDEKDISEVSWYLGKSDAIVGILAKLDDTVKGLKITELSSI